MVDGLLVLDGHRLVVPPQDRPAVLALLHQSHCGIVKTTANARDLYFWPGMERDVVSQVASCHTCQTLAPAQPREPLVFTLATSPMEQVRVDLFEALGLHWLVMVDRFSGFPFLHRLRSLDSSAVTVQLDKWFLVFGTPELLRSDGGPQFRTAFGQFCLSKGIEWELSSPYNSQSNGLAKSAVKAMKRLVLAVEPSLLSGAVQEWSNTPPRADGISPSLAFFGRRSRGSVPFIPQPMVDFPSRSPLHDDSGHNLRPLAAETEVWIQLRPGSTWKRGTVRATKGERSYLVELPGGRSYVRNRRFLRPLAEFPDKAALDPQASDPVQPEAVVAPENVGPRRSRRTAGMNPENAALAGSRI